MPTSGQKYKRMIVMKATAVMMFYLFNFVPLHAWAAALLTRFMPSHASQQQQILPLIDRRNRRNTFSRANYYRCYHPTTILSARIIKKYDYNRDFTSGSSEYWPYDDSWDMRRIDETDDSVFYSKSRFVTHIDEWAILSLRHFYGKEIENILETKEHNNAETATTNNDDKFKILDLCSSWISHLPNKGDKGFIDASAKFVAGVGMNEEELSANTQLNAYHVQDLNKNPSLTSLFGNETFDVILLAVSVDYLTRPREVFRELHRLLRPGGSVLVAISNRYFRKKAVQLWLETDDSGRRDIVASYFFHSGVEWSLIEAWDIKRSLSLETMLEFVQKQNIFR